jgi:hypothetical protein
LHFARLIGARSGAGIEACVALAGIFAVPLLAAEMDLFEERIVETLDDDGENLVLGQRGSARETERARGKQSEKQLVH